MPPGTSVNDPVTVPIGVPVVASLSVTLVHVQGPGAGCALAVMTNSRAAEPTNSFVSVLIVATEANIPRCVAVVEVIRKASVVLLSAEDNTAIADMSRGGCGAWVPEAKRPEGPLCIALISWYVGKTLSFGR